MKRLFTLLLACFCLTTGHASTNYLNLTYPLDTPFLVSDFYADELVTDYALNLAVTLDSTGGQTASAFLDISYDGITDWIQVAQVSNSISGTVPVGISITNTKLVSLSGWVPRAYYARIRTSGNGTVTYVDGKEYTPGR